MSKEKYKIRLSYHTYYSLHDDMFTYNFCKENGEPNKNKFFNTLITGFYNNFSYRRNNLTEYLSERYGNKFKGQNELIIFSNDIFSKINELYNSDINTKYHNCEVYIYPTKETSSMYDQIETNETKNESMSEFIRNLFNEYIKEPG